MSKQTKMRGRKRNAMADLEMQQRKAAAEREMR
jgi:hypothetical protein